MEEDNKVEEVEQPMAQEEVQEDVPNTRFPRRPETQGDNELFKQPTKSYYRLIKLMTALGDNVTKGTTNFLVSAARGPVEFGKMVKENIEEGLETAKDAPSLTDVGKRLIGKDKEE